MFVPNCFKAIQWNKFFVAVLIVSCSYQTSFSQSELIGAGKQIDPYHYTIPKDATFQHASVACAHPLASMIGAAVMQKGGNAFDAAIATQLALAVVFPEAGNIGGGGFMVARTAKGQTLALDYREMAPEKASRNMYLDKDGNPNMHLSQDGHLASGVPGSVAGIFAMYKYAKLPFEQLITPAIILADKGFVISEKEAHLLNATRADFIKYNTKPNAFVKPTPWKAGDTLVQKDLAKTLMRISQFGAKGFYEGETAKLIVAEMQRGKGIISLEDLKQYKAIDRTPLSFQFNEYTIVGMPPPSSGGIIVEQLMKMIANRPLFSYGFESAKMVQLMVEAERRAFADRAAYMGDPDFWKVPVKTLTSNAYLAQRMANYDSTKPTPSSMIKEGQIPEHDETTHISIMDAEGNMVSITTTLNGWYGSRTVVGGAGFFLNNEMDDFSVKPGVPNMFGAVGGEANAIQPRKRMLSSMAPTLVLKNNQPFMVCGTPGGTTIPTSVFQTLVDVLIFNMSAEQAIAAPKFHHQWLPDVIFVEPNFPKNTIQQLEAMGYKIQQRGPIGRTEIIKVLTNGNKETAADIRGDDAVAGY
ncbi:gamma-glutamyltransferase [Hydrotalea sandarakina]|uniref:Glutathione hydrolase proenzyme n=1 Tax=Hydrotalea sandarakina TaxID=1004304 RepID=A0A2W7RGB3_9BACT|nr:gamma-glutamyltransferase [Hydrotalea sandarakina]PZX59978.1 gamma-glutamyltranspeptidase/glutathione hydrolase [Hydrotalea sandarakina]